MLASFNLAFAKAMTMVGLRTCQTMPPRTNGKRAWCLHQKQTHGPQPKYVLDEQRRRLGFVRVWRRRWRVFIEPPER